ncbi:MAG: hypothetical protein RL077_3120, partial [Verrucomicrobiota bacterium]
VGGNRIVNNAIEVMTGRTTLETAAKDAASGAIRDFANAAAGVGPIPRAVLTGLTGKETFPDVTDMHSIPGSEIKWSILSQMVGPDEVGLYRYFKDDDYYPVKSLGDWAKQTFGQSRRRDGAQWAYFNIREKADAFEEAHTGVSTQRGTRDAPDRLALRAFRKAIYDGDLETAAKAYNRLLAYGYTADRFRQSIASSDPLSGLPKNSGLRRQFVESLSPFDRRQLDLAWGYYDRMAALKNSEKILFPAKAYTEAGTEARLQSYRANPRTEELIGILQRTAGQSEADREARSANLERRSLRNSR